MILVELTAAIDSAGTLQTFYVSTDSFVTAPTDTPGNQDFMPVLGDAGFLGIHAFSDGRTSGATQLETGELVLINEDGSLDSWVNYSFDGRPVTIRSGTSGAYPSAFPAVLVATVESIEANWEKMVIRLRDKQWKFELPLQTTRYAGTGGLEGGASDIKAKVKPRAYGKVMNIAPPCVNTTTFTYQVSDRAVADIPNVYIRAAALTKGADYATSTLLQAAAAPAAGTYITCMAEGYFRISGNPAGMVTADVIQGAAASNRTAAQIMKQIALDAGLGTGEISSTDVAALDTANSAVVGIWINDENTTFQQALDQIAASVSAYYGFDSTGTLRMGVLTAPSGTPPYTLQDYDIQDGIERRPAKDNGLPIYRVTMNHSKYYTVQASDFDSTVTQDRKAQLAAQYRAEKAEDTSVKTQWLLSPEKNITGLLTSSSDAATEAARLMGLYKVRRDVFDVPVNISVFTTNAMKLMDVVAMQTSRFGMSSGKSFRLIGYQIQLTTDQVILTLWG